MSYCFKSVNFIQQIASFAALTDLDKTGDEEDPSYLRHLLVKKDTTPYIYLCATMWHESDEEMIQILKSIFRLEMIQILKSIFRLGFKNVSLLINYDNRLIYPFA